MITMPDEYGSLDEAMTHCVTLEESRRSVLTLVRNLSLLFHD